MKNKASADKADSMFCRQLIVGLFMLFVIAPVRDSFANQVVRVPKGNSITLDGKLSAEEWKGALKQELKGGGEVWLMHDGNQLLVGLRAPAEGWGHLYLTLGKQVHVLHASAALGKAVYQPDEAGLWQPVQSFKWELRDQTQSNDALVTRAAYLEANGWIASTNRMGTPCELEFKVSARYRQGREMKLAVMCASDAKQPRFWPRTLSDDSLKETLVYGDTPAGLNFVPAQWAVLEW